MILVSSYFRGSTRVSFSVSVYVCVCRPTMPRTTDHENQRVCDTHMLSCAHAHVVMATLDRTSSHARLCPRIPPRVGDTALHDHLPHDPAHGSHITRLLMRIHIVVINISSERNSPSFVLKCQHTPAQLLTHSDFPEQFSCRRERERESRSMRETISIELPLLLRRHSKCHRQQ